jgi:hypothetical protein
MFRYIGYLITLSTQVEEDDYELLCLCVVYQVLTYQIAVSLIRLKKIERTCPAYEK